jgi:hypothetical protein
MADGDPQAQTGTYAPPYDGVANKPKDPPDFWQKIDIAIANLADVTVATVISDVTVAVDNRGRLKDVAAPTTSVPAIITNVNLIDGNVTTVIGPELKDDESLTGFHQGLVDKAVKILPDNLKALANLVEGFFGRGTGSA